MESPKRIVNLVLAAIFTLILTFNCLPGKAITKTAITKDQMAKAQITKAAMAVAKAERIVMAADFNIVTAQKQLDLAIKDVSKIKLFGKKYIGNYTALSKRNIEVSKKISRRKLAIKKAEAEKARIAEEEEQKRLIEEAENKVAAAEKLINSSSINLKDNLADLKNAQDAVTSALEAVIKLNKSTEEYKKLMDRIDGVNMIITKADDTFDKKPVIYLYPTTKQDINVKIGGNIGLVCSYPKYKNNGWNVTAYPDGTLIDKETGRQYYCLYWEGAVNHNFNMSKGFIVDGKDTAGFLENKLKKLGLTNREANEFIIYWLPKLEKNKYNLIHFETEEYNKLVPLEISPKPDSLIRILMIYKPLDKLVAVDEQQFITPERNGFAVVEWGGMEIK